MFQTGNVLCRNGSWSGANVPTREDPLGRRSPPERSFWWPPGGLSRPVDGSRVGKRRTLAERSGKADVTVFPIKVAGRLVDDPLGVFVDYCRRHARTIRAYDWLAGTRPVLTSTLIKSTRAPYAGSRISREQERHLLGLSDTAPWTTFRSTLISETPARWSMTAVTIVRFVCTSTSFKILFEDSGMRR